MLKKSTLLTSSIVNLNIIIDCMNIFMSGNIFSKDIHLNR